MKNTPPKKKKEIPPVKKKKTPPKKKKEIPPAKMKNAPPAKKKRSSPAEEHAADDGGSSSQPNKRPRRSSNPNPKNLQRNQRGNPNASPARDSASASLTPAAASASPIPAVASASPANRQISPNRNPQDRPVTSMSVSNSGSSTKGGTPSSEQGDNEEIGDSRESRHGDPRTSEEPPNATEEQRMGEEEAGGAMRPQKFYFQPADYRKPCKLSTRCHQHGFIKLTKKLDASEKEWFTEHPQFKHLFHMECSSTRKVMGLWMLLLRTIKVDKKRQCWFVVNGAPIRYSIREHGLLSGLSCALYPENYETLGSLRFAKKHFQKKPKKKGEQPPELRVTPADVLKKLEGMKDAGNGERLKMAVLYFLATVIRGRSRAGTPIEHFLLRVVSDLDLCETFPWGRFTFDDSVNEIKHMVKHFRGKIPERKCTWTFPGFIIPLEILAFESIPVLKEYFREDVEEFDEGCPRMCKSRFVATGSTGYALDVIYKKLGKTKEIFNVLEPKEGELELLWDVMGERLWDDFEVRDDEDRRDAIVDGWNKLIFIDRVKIIWEDLYQTEVEEELQSTLEVMAAAAEKAEEAMANAAAQEKAAKETVQKEGDEAEDAAKEAVEDVGALTRPKRVLKPSRLKKSPFVEK